jgi:hypothetical protein
MKERCFVCSCTRTMHKWVLTKRERSMKKLLGWESAAATAVGSAEIAPSCRAMPGAPDYDPVGSRNVKVLPTPSLLSTQMVPPCASTMAFTIDNPKPAPPCVRVRAVSTR